MTEDTWRAYRKRTMSGDAWCWWVLGCGLLAIAVAIGGWKAWEWYERSVPSHAAASNDSPVLIDEGGE